MENKYEKIFKIDIDFGSFAQLQANAYIAVTYSGSVSSNGVSNYQGNPEPSSIGYKSNLENNYSGLLTEAVTLSSATDVISSNADCPHTITQITPSSTSFNATVDSNGNYSTTTIKYGATLTLTQECKTGN